MKRLITLLIAALMLLTLASCGQSGGGETAADGSKEINIFMWSDYLSDDVVADFENETGIKVNLSYMNDNADSINKLTAGAGDEYDLIMTCDAYMESLIAGGYLEELDLSQIPNSENINKAYWSEQNQKYCVPYLMNYIYVVYDTERCPIEITCYNDLIRPEMKGQIGSVDGARNLFPIALIALGYDPNSRDENEIKEAYEWLVKYNENVVAYGSTETNIVSGAISCMFTYDGNTAEAMAQLGEDNTLVVAPFTSDPVQLGFDLYVIPKGAQHMDLAYQFLNYICDPEVMAANLVDNPYSCPNDAAVAAASEEYRNGPAFDFDYKTNIFFQEDVGDAITIYDQYYQMLKVG